MTSQLSLLSFYYLNIIYFNKGKFRSNEKAKTINSIDINSLLSLSRGSVRLDVRVILSFIYELAD